MVLGFLPCRGPADQVCVDHRVEEGPAREASGEAPRFPPWAANWSAAAAAAAACLCAVRIRNPATAHARTHARTRKGRRRPVRRCREPQRAAATCATRARLFAADACWQSCCALVANSLCTLQGHGHLRREPASARARPAMAPPAGTGVARDGRARGSGAKPPPARNGGSLRSNRKASRGLPERRSDQL